MHTGEKKPRDMSDALQAHVAMNACLRCQNTGINMYKCMFRPYGGVTSCGGF